MIKLRKKNEYRVCNPRKCNAKNRYMIILHTMHTIVIVRVSVTNKIKLRINHVTLFQATSTRVL